MTISSGSFTYDYDAAGKPASLTNPFGETTSWTYGNNNWLASQTDDNSSGDLVSTASYSYDERGFLTDLANMNSSGDTLSEFGSTNPTYAMTYDAMGNRTVMAVNDAVATGYSGTTDYTYDNRNELTQEASTRNGSYTNNFAYDGAENPTTFRSASVPTANSDNQIAVASEYVYDGSGNPTTYNSASLTFDPENRMTADGNVLTCGYTPDGLRAWKQNSTGTIYFLYDGQTAVCELGASGTVTATDTRLGIGLVSRNAGGSSTFYSFDAQGSTSQRLTSAGAVASSGMTDAFGGATATVASDPYSGYGAKFGYYSDSETGLLLLGHRFYDPALGRFINRDPIGSGGGLNLYAYCHNSPTFGIDPYGDSCCPIGYQILAAILTAMIMVKIAASLIAICVALGEAVEALCLLVAGCAINLLTHFFFRSILASLCPCEPAPAPPTFEDVLECALGYVTGNGLKGLFPIGPDPILPVLL